MGVTLEAGQRRGRLRVRRVLQIAISLAVIAAVFVYALPKFADYSEV